MLNAIKRSVAVQRGGRIELRVAELPEGSTADVIVLEERRAGRRKLVSPIGQGTVAFVSDEDADRFIRAERDRWS
ncbi:MAG: hypothetical protein ACK5TK_14195 [Betaproteobacteria bacterium]